MARALDVIGNADGKLVCELFADKSEFHRKWASKAFRDILVQRWDEWAWLIGEQRQEPLAAVAG